MEADWQNNIFRIEERLPMMLEKKLLTDVSFTFGKSDTQEKPKILHAHKLILASASSVFHAMFYGPMAEKTAKAIHVEDIDSETFTMMVKYIYSNDPQLKSCSDAAKLYGAAKKYMLNALSKYCIDYKLQHLNATNALKSYEFAKFYEEAALLKAARMLIRKETRCIIQSPDFLEIDVLTMIAILDEDELQASEKELFDALENLAKAHQILNENLQHQNNTKDTSSACEKNPENNIVLLFRTAVKKINFLKMTAEQFVNGPSKSNLLLPDESLAILSSLVSPLNKTTLYPKEFSQSIRMKCPIIIQLHFKNFGTIFIEVKSKVTKKTRQLNIYLNAFCWLQFIIRNNNRHFSEENSVFNISLGTALIDVYRFDVINGGPGKFFDFDESKVFGKVVQGMDVLNKVIVSKEKNIVHPDGQRSIFTFTCE